MTAAPALSQVGQGQQNGVATHCPYCALQCATMLTPTPGSAAGVEVTGRDFPTNRGGLCQKGWTAPALLAESRRLTSPLIRTADGSQRPVSWDEALDLVGGRLRDLRERHGPASVAVFGGGGLTNEKAYALGKFARVVLRTPNIDYNGRFCMSSAAAAGIAAFGVDRGLPFPLADLAGADAVLLVGSNPAETMPPALAHLRRATERGGLIVIDPRRTATAALAEDGGGLHLQPTPGTDLALVLGLLHVVLHEGLLDARYIADRTTGSDAARRSVSTWWPERVETVTGVPATLIRGTARRLAAASPNGGGAGAYVLTGRGAEQHTKGTATVSACIDVALALGLPGRHGSGYGCVTGQGNGQGGREHGQKADQLPGYRKIADPAARAHVAKVWGIDPDELPGPGPSAVELFNALGRPADPARGIAAGPRALLVHGCNLVVSAPRTTGLADRLRELDLLVVCDVVPSETARLADVVLPVAQWAEEDGTMTTLEGRVVRRRRAVAAPDGVRDELSVLAELADRLGRPGVIPRTAVEVFDELRAASAGGPADYSGISYQRLESGEALFWPCPATMDGRHPGTPRMFLDRFTTSDGRARFVAVDHQPVDDDLRADAPVYLLTGRVLQHYQSGAQTRRVPELAGAVPEAYIEIHPDLAARLGITDGDRVRLTSARGTATAPARITRTVRPDCVFMPFHWGGTASANLLTNDALDPISRMPELKVCAVRVEREHGPAVRT